MPEDHQLRASPSPAKTRHSPLALLAALLALTLFAAPNPRAAEEQVVDAGSFRVTAPADAVWEITAEPDRVLMRRDRHASGQRVGTTAILALRTKPSDEECGLPEQETAESYCDSEEFQLWLNGQVSGLFGVSDVEREAVTLDDKTLYTMRYHLEFAEEYGGAVTDNRMYIYFPPSFAADNYFFVFMQTEACMPGHCDATSAIMDESPLRAVISSLQAPPPVLPTSAGGEPDRASLTLAMWPRARQANLVSGGPRAGVPWRAQAN